jgi:hypothetical protein
MTPQTIAYVAIQVYITVFIFVDTTSHDAEQARFAMSSTGTWANIDGPFIYSDFYWRIVKLFEDEEEGAALIKFYNQYVPVFFLPFILLIIFIMCSHIFGTVSESDVEGGQIARGDDEDDYEILKRQRTEKRARLAGQRSASVEV